MKNAAQQQGGSIEEIRKELVARLRNRLPQIEDKIFGRIYEIASSVALADPEYAAGIRDAVSEGIDYALTGLERGEKASEAIPSAASAQACRAARSGTPLDTVLRRYHAGDRLLAEFIMGEADDLPCEALQEILRTQSSVVDHLTATIATEYMHEFGRMRRSPTQQLRERVRRLLDGDQDEDPTLNYKFDRWHVGLVASGEPAEEVVRQVAKKLDCQVLLVPSGGDDVVWAWLGRRHPLSMPEVEGGLTTTRAGVSMALGEPRQGIEGWRRTHQEAQSARQVSIYRPKPQTRFRDSVLLSAVMRDQSLATSLVKTYLAPLDGRREAGEVLRKTLRAYLASNQNAKTAAAALGVARTTVERRLRHVEEKLGQTLSTCSPQIQVALDVEELIPRLFPSRSGAN